MGAEAKLAPTKSVTEEMYSKSLGVDKTPDFFPEKELSGWPWRL
jgi:hypothetical protein